MDEDVEYSDTLYRIKYLEITQFSSNKFFVTATPYQPVSSDIEVCFFKAMPFIDPTYHKGVQWSYSYFELMFI